jgi:mono/diheme cytochrome c family protein
MPFATGKALLAVLLLLLVAAFAAGLFVWSGVYDIGADNRHTRPVHAVLQTLRERSIERHARHLAVPDLTGDAVIRSGAGNYDVMCSGCHLSPGTGDTELSKGLYPAPPDFSRLAPRDPKHDFWVIKHGIKASGMPAWGKSMEDPYIWGMAAFLQQLPTLDAAAYTALVASSDGHSHGGGETGGHHPAGGEAEGPHDEGAASDHHDAAAGMDMQGHGEPANHEAVVPGATGEPHDQPDARSPAPPKGPADGHDHQH